MKKLLGLLGAIMISGNSMPSVIATSSNRKHNIKKRQNNENTLVKYDKIVCRNASLQLVFPR